MSNSSKLLRKSILYSTVLCISITIFGNDFFDDISLDFDDNYFSLIAHNDYLDDENGNELATPYITRNANPETVAMLLVEIGFLNLLNVDLYCKTHPLNIRSLLDLPIFLPQRTHLYKWTLGTHLFWNQTPRMNFTCDSTCLSSYLGLNNPTLLSLLDSEDIQLVFNEFDVNPVGVLQLFCNTSIEDRRFGFMFYSEYESDLFRFRAMAPIYYHERNYFLCEETRDKIEQELGRACEEEAAEFQENHLVSDQLGLGDLRVTFDAQILELDKFSMRVGAMTTVPTAWTFADSMLGSIYRKNPCKPEINFCELFDLGQGDRKERNQANEMVQNFAQGALDSLSAILLDTDLGNKRHLGIGLYLDTQTALEKYLSKFWWTKYVVFFNRMSLEYLLPRNECRCYIACCDCPCFAALDLNRPQEEIAQDVESDPEYAQQVLNFMQEQFVDKFYPFVYKTRVSPGFIFHSTSKVIYEREKWGFHIGTDFWWQQQEKLSSIDAKQIAPCRPLNINVGIATKPSAYQTKVHTSFFWKVKRAYHDWALGLNAGGTIWSSGIGKDYSLSFNFEINF